MITAHNQLSHQFDDCGVIEPACFLDELTNILATASKRDGKLALVVLRVLQTERFSSILGWLAAEEVLRRCTTKIRHALGDRAAVFRIGSDKLAVTIFDIRNEGHALLAAQKLQRLINQPLVAAGQKIRLTCAQGLSLFPTHGSNSVDLIRCAEAALEEAQETGVNVRVHSPDSGTDQSRQWKLEQHVERALSEGSLLVAFHPKVGLKSNAIRGAEALLRFADSDVSPEEFIETAEYMGRVLDVTSVVLNAALRHAAEWHEMGQSIGVSVNVTPSVIRSAECIDLVKGALKIWSVPNNALTLEVTESTFLEDPESCFRTLSTLRDMGVGVSIDDFGTGYSSLSYFKHIPARELKIDRTFVTDMLQDDANARIVNAVVQLAHAFGFQVVAEGVEDAATLEALKALDCDIIQGHYLTPPLLPEDFLRWQQHWAPDSKAGATSS